MSTKLFLAVILVVAACKRAPGVKLPNFGKMGLVSEADMMRDWFAHPVPCVIEGEPVAPTEARVLDAFAWRFPLCADPQWRQVIAVQTTNTAAPVVAEEFVFPSGAARLQWWLGRIAMRVRAPQDACVLLLDMRAREGAFLASVGGDVYRGCVRRYAVGEKDWFSIRVRGVNE